MGRGTQYIPGQSTSDTWVPVPDSLRTQFRYQIYADQRSAAWVDGALPGPDL